MVSADPKDPYSSFNFDVAIDDVPLGAFSEVSGLTAEGDAIDYYESAYPQSNERKLTGLHKYTNITLKRGYTQDRSLWDWYRNTTNGQSDRRKVTITLMNEAQQPIKRWHCNNAWVTKIEGPSFEAGGNEVALESVEITHEGLTIETAANNPTLR